MLLKGIIMIVIGLVGISGTIMWFVKSTKRADRDNGDSSYKGKAVSTYTNRRPSPNVNEKITSNNNSNYQEFGFYNEESESTVLLDEFDYGSTIQETVLLEDDDE